MLSAQHLLIRIHEMNVYASPNKLRQLIKITPATAGKQKGCGCCRLGCQQFLLDATYREYLKGICNIKAKQLSKTFMRLEPWLSK